MLSVGIIGASGQAVQNLNRMMGWADDTALKAAALYPQSVCNGCRWLSRLMAGQS